MGDNPVLQLIDSPGFWVVARPLVVVGGAPRASRGGYRGVDPVRVAGASVPADRAPSIFAAPHGFDLLRSPNPQVAFGIGPRVCLGAHVARLEAAEMLRQPPFGTRLFVQ